MISKFKIKNLKLKILAKQEGFTVLESIVAIFVLSLSVSGAFSAVQQSLSQAIIAKDEIKAFYLAQEGVEIVKNRVYSNQLDKIAGNPSTTWLMGTANDGCGINDVCMTEASNLYLKRCPDATSASTWGSCPFLNQDTLGSSPTFLYGYDSSWPTTNFKREIKLELLNSVEVLVTVRISWTKGTIPMVFEVKTIIFDWI
jgi:type II secretory pathway pseudopilin PulG